MPTSSATPNDSAGDRPDLHESHADVLDDRLLANIPSSADKTHLHAHTKAHPHIHDPEAQRKLVNRLSRIEGHVRGIRSMIQHQEPCPDVLLQLAAVRGALDRVARLVLDDHITECIAHAAESGDIKVELDELKRALDRFIR
ncbi:MAG: metal-sensing transcriptional repressor [Synechococcus sp.]